MRILPATCRDANFRIFRALRDRVAARKTIWSLAVLLRIVKLCVVDQFLRALLGNTGSKSRRCSASSSGSHQEQQKVVNKGWSRGLRRPAVLLWTRIGQRPWRIAGKRGVEKWIGGKNAWSGCLTGLGILTPRNRESGIRNQESGEPATREPACFLWD